MNNMKVFFSLLLICIIHILVLPEFAKMHINEIIQQSIAIDLKSSKIADLLLFTTSQLWISLLNPWTGEIYRAIFLFASFIDLGKKQSITIVSGILISWTLYLGYLKEDSIADRSLLLLNYVSNEEVKTELINQITPDNFNVRVKDIRFSYRELTIYFQE